MACFNFPVNQQEKNVFVTLEKQRKLNVVVNTSNPLV